ncbi:MAG TPA: hypothetical protein VF271_01895 [Rhodanobacteraceae bacterium]
MRTESSLSLALHVVLACICTIAIALALGALWMAAMLAMPSARWWFALVSGAVLGFVAHNWITRHPWLATLLAAAGTVLAAVYMGCLRIGMELAATFGLGLVDTLQRAGVAMLVSLAWATATRLVIVATLVGMALAALLAWRRGRRANVIHRAP